MTADGPQSPTGRPKPRPKAQVSPLRQKLAQRGPRPPNPLTRDLEGHEWFMACAKLGGKARMAGMTAEQRSALGRRAALKRWHPEKLDR